MGRNRRGNVHVVPAGASGRFVARVAGERAPFTAPTTQGLAIRAAIKEARVRKCEVVIHRGDGRIRDSDSYGGDSPRVRDLKH